MNLGGLRYMILTYLAGIITTVGGAFIVHMLAQNRWWKEYRLRKLEELYTAVQNHEIAVAEYYTRAATYLTQPEDAENLKELEEALGRDYLKSLQEDERKSVAILMIVSIYFKDLLPTWRVIELTRKQISVTNSKAMMLDKGKREALGRERREAIAKEIGVALITEHLPLMAARKDEMLAQIVRSADRITDETLWPFASPLHPEQPRLVALRKTMSRLFRL